MSGCEPLDEATFTALLEDVHTVVSHLPAPKPSPALAVVLTKGLSTEKGELLARAGSNVTGPVPQASGLPKWRQDEVIGTAGFLSGLVGKVAGLGIPAKVLMCLGITMTGLTAGAGAGALPGPLQGTVAGVVNTVMPFQLPDGGSGATTTVAGSLGTPGGTEQAGASVGVDASSGAASVGAGANASGAAGAAGGSVGVGAQGSAGADADAGGSVDLPVPGLPVSPTDLLHNLPVQVPSCVSSIIDSAGHVMPQPAALASQVLSCVTQLAPAGSIPPAVSNCLTSLLNSVSATVGGGVPTSLPTLNVSSCVPVDVSQCVSSIMSHFANPTAILSNMGSLGNLTNLFNLGNLTNLTSLPGCVPFNLDHCVSSILGAAPGGLATVDLSACVPANVIGNLPLPFGH
jgi:hypothetical protein